MSNYYSILHKFDSALISSFSNTARFTLLKLLKAHYTRTTIIRVGLLIVTTEPPEDKTRLKSLLSYEFTVELVVDLVTTGNTTVV